MSALPANAGVLAIAEAVKSRAISAAFVTEVALERISALDPQLNCFTHVLRDRARRDASDVDSQIAAGIDPGPLAGVPFAVKNLFDIEGLPTLAGSAIRATAPHASRDAAAVSALTTAGAVLLGALNMDEFAYGFTTENTHYGPTRNPHDLSRVAGGSSGGSAAAVAAGMVPFTLGSDTNGSVRVPASFCGIFGMKPTYGRTSRRGAFLFVSSLDHVGSFARSVEDLAAVHDLLQSPDSEDPVSTGRPLDLCSPTLRNGIEDLRIARAGGYFEEQETPHATEAVDVVARALAVGRTVELPEAARARAAAYVITASEGGNHHLNDLRSRAAEYDNNTRSRFLAGALVPAAWVSFAQRFRAWYRLQMVELFRHTDVILAPATPCPAIQIRQKTIRIGGVDVPSRPNIGIFTQPISFIGLPVITVPVHLPGRLPIGVQLIGAPWQEPNLFRVAAHLESLGVVSAPVASLAEAVEGTLA